MIESIYTRRQTQDKQILLDAIISKYVQMQISVIMHSVVLDPQLLGHYCVYIGLKIAFLLDFSPQKTSSSQVTSALAVSVSATQPDPLEMRASSKAKKTITWRLKQPNAASISFAPLVIFGNKQQKYGIWHRLQQTRTH